MFLTPLLPQFFCTFLQHVMHSFFPSYWVSTLDRTRGTQTFSQNKVHKTPEEVHKKGTLMTHCGQWKIIAINFKDVNTGVHDKGADPVREKRRKQRHQRNSLPCSGIRGAHEGGRASEHETGRRKDILYIRKWRMRFFGSMLKKIDESRPFSQQAIQHHEHESTILFFLRIFIDTSTTAHLRK